MQFEAPLSTYLFSEAFDLKPTSEKKGTGKQVLPANHAN